MATLNPILIEKFKQELFFFKSIVIIILTLVCSVTAVSSIVSGWFISLST